MINDRMIETIIAEVKRVLEERGIPVSSGIKNSGQTAAPVRSAVIGQTSAPVLRQVNQQASGNDLSGRKVITLKDLETVSGSVVRVAAKAVITPLAVDYARQKGMTVERVAGQKQNDSCGSSPGTVTVALAFEPSFTGNRELVTAMMTQKGFLVKLSGGQSYKDSVNTLAKTVASGNAAFGVCIENSGMAAPIYANRNSSIRAAHVRNTMEARAARVDYGANVIVLDSGSDPSSIIAGFCGME